MTVEFAPTAGKPFRLAPDLALVLAPNPSPMTYLGTNTYLLGHDELAIIDPGPDDPAHMAALTRAIGGRTVSHILLTHSHLDHSPLASGLSALTGAPIYAFGDSRDGRSAVMAQLAENGLAGGGEGIDHDFKPDHHLKDSDVLVGDWGQIAAIHTPGHIGNHLCFAWCDVMFTGDHVMGWASSLVSPPDGDLTDFMTSCARLQSFDAAVYYPGHGAPITDPQARLAWLIDHRNCREAQILAVLAVQAASASEIAAIIYDDVAPALRLPAERNVFAHLVDLHERGKVTASPLLSAVATFAQS
ncbi:glyoxylase-like metal-dependent hydrolase (beta-lactamase superfamily II) [Yoonia maricola]|uniref:Glyoxylase-like metal-dependent hydrolase (Beta-lactamase superfamily II) n=1 Tax=Yoonia maricola TaxID=420999 RepID=A0A2M8WLF8_9RHOB|nr:MBL fold metallo-hydrolase [Yoonia maricola]PJI91761.1 glyoxylase-like metal-dependent hydrolase (beta-lactamase superfamily II) [Yoonia maricola]